MVKRLLSLLGGSWGIYFCAGIGILLTLPGITSGLLGDDYLNWIVLQRQGPLGQGLPALVHVYNFIPGGIQREVLQAEGLLTWWSDPNLNMAFLRPLTVLSFLVDHWVGPYNFVFHHGHSLLWYGLSVLVAGWLYRRIQRRDAVLAGLACLMFAVEDSHVMNVTWIANRHALLAFVAGGSALLFHIRWREEGGKLNFALALGTLSLGLFSSEATLGGVAYILAWEATLAVDRWTERSLALFPYLVVISIWRIGYKLLGFGINGSDLYLDPALNPIAFGKQLLIRWPLLQFSQWFQIPIDLTLFIPLKSYPIMIGLAIVLCCGLGWFFWPLVKSSQAARFWALGMSLSLVPLCAAFPMDRLLIFTGIGAFGLLGLQAQNYGLWSLNKTASESEVRRLILTILLILHLPLAAVLLPLRTFTLPLFGNVFSMGSDSAPDDSVIKDQSFFFVSGHELPVGYISIMRSFDGRPSPKNVALLSSFVSDTTITRKDARTLIIEPDDGFLTHPADRLERCIRSPFLLGERIPMPDFEVLITQVTTDGRPKTVEFKFNQQLESPEYRWFKWGLMETLPFEVPKIGETTCIPRINFGRLLTAKQPEKD